MKIQTKYIAIAAVTIDGKIAKDSRHLSTEWTSKEDKIFFRRLLKECGVILIGNNTYQTAKGPLAKRNCIVLTRSVDGIKKANDHLVFFNTDKAELKKFIAQQNYQKVAILGGAQIYTYCLENQMLDELYLTVEPIIFGKGIDLFAAKSFLDLKFKLVSAKTLNEQGSLVLHYKR